MRTLIVRVAVVATVLALGSLAWAQEASSQPVQLRKVIINFTEEVIEGSLDQPDLDVIKARPRTKFESLVKVRTNFRAELLRSAYSL